MFDMQFDSCVLEQVIIHCFVYFIIQIFLNYTITCHIIQELILTQYLSLAFQILQNQPMSKEQEGQEMFEIDENHKPPTIGTQILDPTMPSDLNFDDNNKKQLEGNQVSADTKYIKGSTKILATDQIKSYSIKGKLNVQKQPKYKHASFINEHLHTIEVKAFDEQKSGGFKSLWETVVGYVKREICIQEGYLYIFEKTKVGYMTHAAINLGNLFKIFVDNQQSKIRLVFHNGKQHLNTKNFQVKNCEQFVQKIAQQISKVGLIVRAQ